MQFKALLTDSRADGINPTSPNPLAFKALNLSINLFGGLGSVPELALQHNGFCIPGYFDRRMKLGSLGSIDFMKRDADCGRRNRLVDSRTHEPKRKAHRTHYKHHPRQKTPTLHIAMPVLDRAANNAMALAAILQR